MIQADAFIKAQDAKVAQLASHVETWLQEGLAVVGLNEIHRDIVTKLQRKLEGLGVYVDFAIDDSNCLLWRTPQWSTYLVLACLPCLPALPRAGAACPAFLPCLPALPGAGASTPSELSPEGRTRTQCAQHAHNKHTHTRTQHMML